MLRHLLLLAASLVCLLPSCAAVDFYVKSSSNQTCPGQPCYSLNQYAQNLSLFEDQRNISLLLLSGNHSLTHDLNITRIDTLVIRKSVYSSVVDVDRVVIDLKAKIYVSSVSVFGVYNISMTSKDLEYPPYYTYDPVFNIMEVETNYTYDPVFNIMEVETITQYQVEMENVTIGIINDGIRMQSTSIIRCSYYNGSSLYFIYSEAIDLAAVQIQSTQIISQSKSGNEPLLFICPFHVHNRLSLITVDIQDSVIEWRGDGINIKCPAAVQIKSTQIISNTPHNIGASPVGLSFGCPFLIQNRSSLITMDIQDSVIEGWGFGIRIYNPFYKNHSKAILNRLSIQRTNITDNVYGAMIRVLSTVNNFIVEDTRFVDNEIVGLSFRGLTMNFTIQDTYFENNGMPTSKFGGLHIILKLVNKLTIKDTNLNNNQPFGVLLIETNDNATNAVIKNTTVRGSQFGITILNKHKNKGSGNTISCQNCTIASNNVAGITLMNTPDTVIVSNSKFHDNRGTPVVAYGSKLELSGETNFENNTATRGGGLSLIYSNVYFANNSNITFRNNSAKEFGGAIYVVSKRYAEQTSFRDLIVSTEEHSLGQIKETPCFYQFYASTRKDFETLQIQVSFINNTAMLGGEEIYGAPLNNICTNLDGQFSINESQNIFVFKEAVNKISPIASDPTRVCFCDANGRPQCKNTTIVHNEVRFPGEIFNVPLVLVGYNFGTVTGSIYANVLSTGSHKQLGQNQHTQAANFRSCNNLVYSVHSKDSSEVIKLTASEQESSKDDIERNKESASCKPTNPKPCTALLTTPIYINITLETCPLGFKHGLMCECDDTLSEIKEVICEISNHKGYINHEGTVWVGVNQNDTNNTYYLISDYCPHNYCNHERTTVDLTDPDSQCSKNHSGNLCGRCKDGYSLQLGSNRCLDCPNNNGLALLIFFAVAGFLHVFFIKFLDLTVAHGTINGLIFYANIIWMYSSILSTDKNLHGTMVNLNEYKNGYDILRVPIAWLNLDFGFETCFLEGMDANTKSWLQFVFPVYIWSIAGLIILICHYSTRATRLFGNNSISVLATLFLLSYGKLIGNISNIFTYVDLKYSDRNETLKVWSVDGTIGYWELKHVFLFLAGLVCLIVLWLPYTLTLLLVPCLKRWDHLKPLRWINNLKPFYDAYYGPFKDKIRYQCWTGVLLIVRGMVLIIFTITSTSNPNANILFLVVIATALLMYSAMVGLPYKKWYVSLLENLYILNLLILGGGFLFTQTNSQANIDNNENLNPVVATSISLALIQFVCILLFHLYKRLKLVFNLVCKRREASANGQTKLNARQQRSITENIDRSYGNELRESLLDSTVSYHGK